MRPTHSGSGN